VKYLRPPPSPKALSRLFRLCCRAASIDVTDASKAHAEIADDAEVWVEIGGVHERLIRVEELARQCALQRCY
jgi:hypothetical protein